MALGGRRFENGRLGLETICEFDQPHLHGENVCHQTRHTTIFFLLATIVAEANYCANTRGGSHSRAPRSPSLPARAARAESSRAPDPAPLTWPSPLFFFQAEDGIRAA